MESARCRARLDYFLDDGLYAVPVGIDYKGGKIVRTVFRMESHAAIVASAMLKRRSMKCGCRRFRPRREGEMKAVARRNQAFRSQPDGKDVFGPGNAIAGGHFLEAGACFMRPNTDITERSERRIIKRTRAREIADRKGEVMQH